MPLAIRTAGLGRRFGPVHALDALTLEVPRGVIFGFLGPNGSGKSTTIRLLLGLLKPSSGKAEVLGFDTQDAATAIRERTGALLEHCGLYERLSAADNLDLYGRFWRMEASARKARLKELLQHLDLWDRRQDVVAGWSRGMKQKLAIARTLMHRPELIFLDEPTAGLDPLAASQLRADLLRLAANEGLTVFITTHNLGEAERICGLVGVVHNGRLLAVGPPTQLAEAAGTTRIEITGDYPTETVFALLQQLPGVVSARLEGRILAIAVDSARDVAGVVAAMVSFGHRIDSIRSNSGSLEDAFHSLLEGNRG